MADPEASKQTSSEPNARPQKVRAKHPKKPVPAEGGIAAGADQKKPQPGGKLRGLDRDSPEVRISKTLSWILRHAAEKQGLKMRPDGYIKVVDLLSNPKIKSTGLDLEGLQHIVKDNAKKRFELVFESDASAPGGGAWWIRASQGHSINTVEVEYQPIKSLADIPSGIAVHGTNLRAWNLISTEGLSKMARNHIHLAQGVAGENVISGMRSSSQILIFIDVEKALSSGIEFFLSANGVVLTKGDERGFLSPTFFQRVENASRVALPGWGGSS